MSEPDEAEARGSLPEPDSSAGGRVPRPGPRNFLARSEQRRLFWRIIPPALLALVAIDWLTRSKPPPGPGPQPAIDTRIESIAGPAPQPGTVVIEAEPELAWPDGDEPRIASTEALRAVRDVAFFRTADHPAWREIMASLAARQATDEPGPAAEEVAFGSLIGMPRSFRGRTVRMRGTLRRLEELPAPADAVAPRFWQGWLEPADGAAAPVIVHLLTLPEGMATGLSIREPVVVEGIFLKTAAYRATDGVRVAPLILAAEPRRLLQAPAASGGGWQARSLGLLAAGTMLAVVAALGVGFLAGGRRRRRGQPSNDLDATFAGFEPITLAESLREGAVTDENGPEGESA